MGAGGLGCPVGLYLAAAGVGRLGIIDGDVVERSNLHRQVAHMEERLGVGKARSLAASMASLNPGPRLEVHERMLDVAVAAELIPHYDIVVDATDNVTTRYLLNDMCCLLKRPLVSGAALRLDGQLSTFHFHRGRKGEEKVNSDAEMIMDHGQGLETSLPPCYRCIHPVAPPAASVGRCNEEGVLGPLPGLIGCVQALEVINIIVYRRANYSGRLLLYSGATGVPRLVRLRERRADCAVCGDNPSITLNALPDYALFCGVDADEDEQLQLLEPHERISMEALQQRIRQEQGLVTLIDVRGRHILDPFTFTISALGMQDRDLARDKDVCKDCDEKAVDGTITLPSLHIPLPEISDYEEELVRVGMASQLLVFVCRRGNDSQRAVHYLRKRHPALPVVDLIGGIEGCHHNRQIN